MSGSYKTQGVLKALQAWYAAAETCCANKGRTSKMKKDDLKSFVRKTKALATQIGKLGQQVENNFSDESGEYPFIEYSETVTKLAAAAFGPVPKGNEKAEYESETAFDELLNELVDVVNHEEILGELNDKSNDRVNQIGLYLESDDHRRLKPILRQIRPEL